MRVTGDRPLWLGLVLYLAVTVAPTVVLWAALKAPSWFAAARPSTTVVAGPPLESLVADLRRLRRTVRVGGQGSRVRRVALLSAYDDVLTDVCRSVGVETSRLTGTSDGSSDRAYARLLAEADLEAAGVALDPPAGRAAA